MALPRRDEGMLPGSTAPYSSAREHRKSINFRSYGPAIWRGTAKDIRATVVGHSKNCSTEYGVAESSNSGTSCNSALSSVAVLDNFLTVSEVFR